MFDRERHAEMRMPEPRQCRPLDCDVLGMSDDVQRIGNGRGGGGHKLASFERFNQRH